jgi:hypothetical protein
MYTHKHFLPPSLIVIGNDKKYIVPGWTPVPMDTDLSDIEHIEPVIEKPKVYEVTGSKGAVYKVTVAKWGTRCSCPAGKFRGKCKHIEQIKEKIIA